MKLKQITLTLAATLALGLAGCGKNESATTTSEEIATKTAETAKVEAAKAAETAKAEAAKADAARVEAAKVEAARVEAAKAADNDKVQGMIDKAKSLIAEGKFTEASSVLQQLAGQSLSSDQAKLVDGLKEQLQKAVAAKATEDAVGSAGNLLKR